ncbi:MAG: GntR family transcriptional regulator [Fibrobacteres bacterium]|nr:GntR family transcriptional regulator [Fibrobacterota bacterium]
MRHLLEALMRQPGRDGQPLPSVRALAAHHGVTPRTMHRVLKALAGQGHLHAIDRKGFFWGPTPSDPAPLAMPIRVRIEEVRERLLEDLRRGVFHPHKPLPEARSLAELHGIGSRRMALLLGSLVEQGWLVRRGRAIHTTPIALPSSHATIVVVSRCDATGKLLLDSERETDFLKSIRSQARELGLEPTFAGWYEDSTGGSLLDSHGARLRLEHSRLPLLGVIASTWLIQDPIAFLRQLRAAKVPVSVWWEHPASSFPRVRTGSLAGFNLSFGASAGLEAGRHLRSMDSGPIAFVSPFHAAEWSRTRLVGLQKALEGTQVPVFSHVDATWESAWHLRQASSDPEQGEARLREILARLLDEGNLASQPNWVVVNDHVAVHLIELLRERGLPRPRIVSFDNTSASESYQFDSFEFHTDGMVRQMLQQILHPKAKLFQDGGLHEMMGRLVVREPRDTRERPFERH